MRLFRIYILILKKNIYSISLNIPNSTINWIDYHIFYTFDINKKMYFQREGIKNLIQVYVNFTINKWVYKNIKLFISLFYNPYIEINMQNAKNESKWMNSKYIMNFLIIEWRIEKGGIKYFQYK